MTSKVSLKISKEWSYLLQEVAILQIFWWFVNLKEHFLQKVWVPAGALTLNLLITGGECSTDWATGAGPGRPKSALGRKILAQTHL